MTLSELAKTEPVFLQRLLRVGGFPPGAIDGDVGPKTRAAMDGWLMASAKIRDELGEFDERSESNMACLTPHCQRMARMFLAECEERGLKVKIICGIRTYAEQREIYAQGRTAPGKVVTKANAGQSMHNFGVAWDFVVFRGREPAWESADMATAGRIATNMGLVWGGNWPMADTPHIQLPGITAAGIRREFESND